MLVLYCVCVWFVTEYLNMTIHTDMDPLHFTMTPSNQVEFSPPLADPGASGLNLRPAAPQDMELKANETDKLIKGMQLKPTDDSIKYDWNTEA